MALTHQEFMGLSSKSWVQDPHANPFKHLAQLLSLFFFPSVSSGNEPEQPHLPSRAEQPDVSSAPAEDSGEVGGSACPPGAQAC